MNPDEIQRATEAMQRLTAEIERATAKGKEGIKEVGQHWSDRVTTAADELVDVSARTGEKLEKALKSPVTAANSTLKMYQEEIKKTAKLANKGLYRGADKAGGAFRGTQSLMTKAMQGFPMAGIFGFMLFGRMKESEWTAQAQKATQVFQNSGRIARGTLAMMNSNIRNLAQSIPGIAAEFEASARSAAEMGITSTQAIEEVSQKFNNATSDVTTMTVALDTHYRIAAGSSAKAAATLVQNTNASYKDSVNLLRDMGEAVSGTGISYSALLGTIMQTTSAMRMQGVQADSIFETIQKAQAGFGAGGMNAARSGAIASAGVQGLAGAVSGLAIGLKAVLGERVTGGQSTGLDANLKYDQGMLLGKGGGGRQFNAIIKEMLKMANEEGGGNSGRMYLALQKIFNLNTETALTLMAIQKATDEDVPFDKAMSQHSDALKEAFDTKGLTQSTFKTLINKLINTVAKLGVNLLDAIVTGLATVATSLKYLIDVMSFDVTKKETADYLKVTAAANKRLGDIFDDSVNNVKNLGSLGAQFSGEVLGRGRYMTDAKTFMTTDYDGAYQPKEDEVKERFQKLAADVLKVKKKKRLSPKERSYWMSAARRQLEAEKRKLGESGVGITEEINLEKGSGKPRKRVEKRTKAAAT